MTNTYMSRPIEPFAVPARVLRTGNNNEAPAPPPPPTRTYDTGGPGGSNFNFELVDLAAACAFLALYVVCRTNVLANTAAVVALLVVILYRLSARGRAIAGPVLAIATTMLVAAIVNYALAPADPKAMIHATAEDLSMPVVVAAALYFTRVRCFTLHILTTLGAGMLAAGLLPGEGWMVSFVAVRYLIFFAVALGLFADFLASTNHKSAPAAAPPIAG